MTLNSNEEDSLLSSQPRKTSIQNIGSRTTYIKTYKDNKKYMFNSS